MILLKLLFEFWAAIVVAVPILWAIGKLSGDWDS
jgi:hypothetical protein